jgi:hypothetical protein
MGCRCHCVVLEGAPPLAGVYPHVPPRRQRCPTAHVVVPQTQRPLVQVPAVPAVHDALPLQTHPPALQVNPGVQAWPQAPQFAASVAIFLHPAGLSQHVWPAAHAAPPLQLQWLLLLYQLQSSPLLQVEPQLQMPVFVSQDPGQQSPFELHPHRFAGRLPPPQTNTLEPDPVFWQLFEQLPQFNQS